MKARIRKKEAKALWNGVTVIVTGLSGTQFRYIKTKPDLRPADGKIAVKTPDGREPYAPIEELDLS